MNNPKVVLLMEEKIAIGQAINLAHEDLLYQKSMKLSITSWFENVQAKYDLIMATQEHFRRKKEEHQDGINNI
jgi:hypothetical protein